MAWAQLIRLPNVFTVLADVSAAFLLVAQGPQVQREPIRVGRVAAGVSLYWAGMVLNDVFDIDRDRQERPSRAADSCRPYFHWPRHKPLLVGACWCSESVLAAH